MKISLIKFDRVKKILKKLPRVLGEQAFLTFLVSLLLSLVFSGFIFYKYSVLVERKEPEIFEKPLKFKEETFKEILKIWEERQRNFEEAEFKEYPDPFRGPTLTEELTPTP